MKASLTPFLFLLVYFTLLIAYPVPETGADSLHLQACSALAAGDSTRALGLLDMALELDPKHGEAYLARGRLFLAAGNLDAARVDFNYASFSKHAEIKARAFIGLGDVYRAKPNRKWWAVREYRLAIKSDSTFRREGLYRIAETAFELGWTHGYNVACDALTELVCLDPEYKNALDLWWKKIFTQSNDELRDVCNRLEELISQGGTNPELLIYIIWIRSRLNQPDSALTALEKLKAISPEHMRSERLLLQAKCLLALDDTLGFEDCYNESLQYAEEERDFTHLFKEAEPIFNPTEAEKWDSLNTPSEKSSFFHVFWKRRDPDPTTPHNERLLTHYRRLQKAKKEYHDTTPHSLVMTSYTYYTLMADRPVYSYDDPYFDSEYDPDIWWDNCRSLALQQRGLFFIRHGEPDMIYGFGLPWETSMTTTSSEAWRYGNNFFLFEIDSGDYFASKSYLEQGNITRAMESETFKDPVPALRQASYGVAFKGPGDMLEMEFYQSIPVSVDSISFGTPEAMVVVYDSVWHELVRQRQKSHRVFTGRDSMCIAVNSVNIQPGPIIYALRMDVPGYRSVVRHKIEPPPYPRNLLELSGIVLGTPPGAGTAVHSRYEVPLFPRPSMNFRLDEAIHVYFEIYGLGSTEDGRCRYRLEVTTSLLEAHEGPLAKIFGKFAWWRDDRRTSLTLGFERDLEAPGGHAMPENFNVDTSFLVPGNYLLTVIVSDEETGQQAGSLCRFEIVSE